MSTVGRQMPRSNSKAHHQRQYSDNFFDNARWSQFSSQDFGYGSRMNRSMQSLDASISSRSSSFRRHGDNYLSSSVLGPGLLDLQSFDTELLPEGYSRNQSIRRKGWDMENESYLAASKPTNLARGLPENKDRACNVAKIKVVVRKRPLNRKEISKKEQDIISIEPNSNSLTVYETKLKVDLTEYVEKHEFVFDAVLNEGVSNDEVYSETVEPIVPLIFNKTKATCFAYGQTGSGKTYTMQPLPLKASHDILRLMKHTYSKQDCQLFVSFFEIYGGKLFDLLNDRKKLFMREDGKQQVCIVGLQEYRVSGVEAIREFIEKGNATRSTGTTGANEESSRSHAILQLCIKRSVDGSDAKPARVVGKLSFIDLAGSERGADTTDNDKQTRMEGAEINKSLLALKECIRALDSDQGHIPFRGSKLTEVLRDSFVGDSRTVMISCISPSSGSCEHTLNTLRYADRVKSLSKGNNSKRYSLCSSDLRDSTALFLSPDLSDQAPFHDYPNDVQEKNSFGWAKQNKFEQSSAFGVDRIPSGREEGELSGYVYSDQYVKDAFYGKESSEQNPSWLTNKNIENHGSPALDGKKTDAAARSIDVSKFETNDSHSDDELNALLKEEEDLMSAHRKQVEETLDIVREEMNLLAEADKPGNQLVGYIFKLNAILSQKSAGILQLQHRLSQFQMRLKEHNVLVTYGR